MYGQSKPKALVTNIAMQCIKGVEATDVSDMLCMCKTQWYIMENMARSLNSKCNFDNGFFTCDLPEDAVLLVLKLKTKSSNHTLVEDMEMQTEKFRPWKKPTKDGKTSPRKLPGVLSPRKNDISVTSDSGPCPSSPTEMEYKP